MMRQLQCQIGRRPPKPYRGILASLTAGLVNRPGLLQPLLHYGVPAFQSLVDLGPNFFVASHRDVCEVIDRDDDFPVGPQLGPAMVCGAFVLGTDRLPFLREDLAFLWDTFYDHRPQGNLPAGGPSSTIPLPRNADTHIARVTAGVETAIANAEQCDGLLDLVQDVIRPSLCRVVQQYLGVGPPDPRWITVLWDVLASLAHRILLPGSYDLANTNDPVVAELLWARETLRLAINEGIDDAATPGRPAPANIIETMYDVLAHRTPAPPPAEELRETIIRNISGLAITGCHPIARAAAQSVDVLLSNPPACRGATEAALAGNTLLFWDFIEEALRFFPPIPLVPRVCPRDTVIGVDSGRPRTVRAGKNVTVGLLPAMFDSAAVPFPYQFRTDRARTDSLVFGRGLRACFGYQFVSGMLVAMLMPLFACGFARAPGREGRLNFDYAIPRSFQLRLSPTAIATAKC
jgi:cytochrome P450